MSEFRQLRASRRQFIVKSSGAAIGAAVLVQSPLTWAKNNVAGTLFPYVPQVLTDAELSTLKAVVSRLIPADEFGGGAVEAQTYVYVDRALAGPYADQLPAYRQGLKTLLAVTQKKGAASLAELPANELDALLSQLETGGVTEPIHDAEQQPLSFADGGKQFFAMVLQHTVEGTFSDPMYGGNQRFVGWRILGYPGIQYVYTKADQTVNNKPKYTNHSVAEFGGKPWP